MASYNRSICLGNFTRDPELSYLPSGTAVCQFALAMNRKFRDASGADREQVTFLDCKAWGKTGEAIAKYIRKGQPLLVEGYIAQDTWNDKATGQRRSKLYLNVERMSFVGGGGQNQAATERTESPPTGQWGSECTNQAFEPPAGHQAATGDAADPPYDVYGAEIPF